MTWDRWELGQKAIFYDENIRPGHTPAALYPPQVEALRRSMLDFSCLIINHTVGPGGVQVDPINGQGGFQTDPALTAAHKTFHEASRIYHGGYSEDTWAGFFKDSFFKPLSGRSRPEGDSRRVSRCNYYYDAFTAGANKSWELFGSSVDDNSDLNSFERSKCPKPDYAFYLPMYHMDARQAIPKVPSPEGRQWNLAQEHSLAGGFSWSNLKELFAFGLRPTPFRVFHKPPQEANLNSYPWLLIEHKKEGVSGAEQTVSCQAANGAACAVKLSQISARYAMVLPSHAHIPPMPTVTTIGSKVKVWITYYAEDFHAPCLSTKYSIDVVWKKRKQGTVMRAIWEGDVAKLEDIIMFQAILENTHTWAMRVFKPLMSSYIEQWRHVHCQVGMFATSSALLRQEQTMARCQSIIPIVQDLLDNHSSVEIDDSKHPKVTPVFLGMLVQQIVTSERQALAEEVDRVIKERLEALTPSWQMTVTQRTTVETPHTSQRRRTRASSNQSTAQSLGSMEDDPDDSTYQDSNRTRSPKSAGSVSEHSDAGSVREQSTRSNSQTHSLIQSPTASPSRETVAEELLHTPDTRHGGSTPLFGSAIPEPPSVSTPKANTPLSPGSPSHFDTPNIESLFQTPSPGTSTGKAPPEAPIFSSPDDGPKRPRAPIFTPPTLPSDIPTIDWEAAREDIEARRLGEFYTARLGSRPSKATMSEPNLESGDKTGDSGVIDLTNDSQES